MAGPRHSLSAALSTVLVLWLVGCGDGATVPPDDDIAGEYSATFSYYVAAGNPVMLYDSRSCAGAINILDHSGDEFSGEYRLVDDTCLLSPDSGAFTGAIEGGSLKSVVGLYTTVVQFDRYDCGLAEGGTVMSGVHTGDGFTLEASASFDCLVSLFESVEVLTELTVTAVQE